jgi:outer membrane protein assembly factor BamB
VSAPLSSLTSGLGGVADIDGDGITEIGLSYADGDFVCLRADTGEEKWRLHLGQVASDIVACDIDGDGRIEFIIGTREGELMALGVSRTGCGLIKWRIPFGFSLGPPVIADFDGDGRSEILVMAGDGKMYGIKCKV